MASKKKAKKKSAKKVKKQSKKTATKAKTVRKKVVLHVFVKPIGEFTHAGNDQPGIRVSDVLLRLAAAASKARLTIRRFATYLETSPKLEELLIKLYARVAPDGPPLVLLKPPSCWNENTGAWEKGACPAANAEFFEPPTPIPGADRATRRLLVGLQCEGP